MNSNDKEKAYFRSFSLYNFRDLSASLRNRGESDSAGFARYYTLGYFDEFRTKRIDVAANSGDMPELWEGIKTMNSELVENKEDDFSAKSYQNIFGYPIPAEKLKSCMASQHGNYVTDEVFWGNHEYPYVFTILIQFFDRAVEGGPNTAIEEKIKTYLKKYNEHIQKNFAQYEGVFGDNGSSPSVEGSQKTAEEQTGKNDESTDSRVDTAVNESFTPSEEEKKFLCSGYITFDKYDFIVCVKTKCYLPFALATEQLYSLFSADSTKECFSVGSFTVTAIDADCINNTADEKLPSICIKCSYNESNIFYYNKQLIDKIKEDECENKFNVLNYMDMFQKKLRDSLYSESEQEELKNCDNYFRMYFISGENDIRFIARYVCVKKLLPLFFEEDSPLNSDFLGGFSTSINVTNNDVHEFELKIDDSSARNDLVKKIIECKSIINQLAERKCPEELIKTMHQINSGMSAIMPMNSDYRGYGFLSLFPDYYSYLKRLYSEVVINERKIAKKDLDDAQDLMQFFGAALLTTIRADFKEFQVPTFNANLYYTPTKLLVFYRAFIVNFLNYYKPLYRKTAMEDDHACNQESIQHFIVVPGNQFGATVFETAGGVYDNGEISERYFTCEISEKNVYCLKTSLIILSHEVSHYGLKKIRNRRNRYEHIWMSYIYTFVVLFLYNLYQEIGVDKTFSKLLSSYAITYIFDTCIFRPEVKHRLTEKICVKYEIRESELRKENDDKNKYHYDKIQRKNEKIFGYLYEFIQELLNDEICTKMQNFLMQYSTAEIDTKIKLNESVMTAVKKVFEKTFRVCLSGYNKNNISSPHSFISYHYKEVFSDIMSVTTLNLKPQDYSSTIVKERRYQMGGLNGRSILYRMSLVIDGVNEAIKKMERKQDSKSLLSFVGEAFDYEKWLMIVDAAKSDNHKRRDELNGFLDLINQYKSVKNKLFDVFACPVNDAKYLTWYRDIESSKKYPTRILFYDENLYRYFVDYLSDCVVSFFSEMYKKSKDTESKKENSVIAPLELFSMINNEEKDYYQKMTDIDAFLSRFENAQLKQLEKPDG